MFLQHTTKIKTCKSHVRYTSILGCKDDFYLKMEFLLVFINQALIRLLLYILGFSNLQRHFTKLCIKGKKYLYFISQSIL